MSMEINILIHEDKIPSLAAWQQAIEKAGFPTTIEAPFDLRADTGYRPAVYDGEETGFEFYLSPAQEILSMYPQIAEAVGNRSKCATFTWSGDLIEMCAALSAAGVLTLLSDGVYFDPQSDTLLTGEEAVETVREEIDSI